MMKIRIKDVPPGEAPEEVRAAWIGLVLPVANGSRRTYLAAGVVTGPKNFLATCLALLLGRIAREDGYAVESHCAVKLLSEHAPSAAAWWRANAPHMTRAGRLFVFAAKVCEEVE